MMKNRWCFGFILLIIATAAGADGEASVKSQRKLSLTTDYLFQRLEIDDGSLGAHTLGLRISLDEKGGKGTLGIDPNI